jgi:hypothetical protein
MGGGEMSELKRYDIVVEHYDTGIGEDEVISLDYREGGDHVSAYEALDIITVLKEQVTAKDAALAARDSRIKELEALVARLKNCMNCKHDRQEDHEPDWGCDGCLEGYTKWEAKP